MALINILLRDNKNKIFQKMLSLREETELLISGNIISINKIESSSNLNINTIDLDFSTLDMEKQGWKVDQGLYDRLIIEYNNRADTEKPLVRWR